MDGFTKQKIDIPLAEWIKKQTNKQKTYLNCIYLQRAHFKSKGTKQTGNERMEKDI